MKRAYTETLEEFNTRMLGVYAQVDKEVQEYREGVETMKLTKLTKEQQDTVRAAVKNSVPDLYEKLGPGNAQGLFDAIVTRATERITTKHDPDCDCGICQYCNGREDVNGNPTKDSEQQIIDLSVAINNMISIECNGCGTIKSESVEGRSNTPVQDFARSIWKYGWNVEVGNVYCPDCREE